MHLRLQPHAPEAETLCTRGCNPMHKRLQPMHQRLQPCAPEAATLCIQAGALYPQVLAPRLRQVQPDRVDPQQQLCLQRRRTAARGAVAPHRYPLPLAPRSSPSLLAPPQPHPQPSPPPLPPSSGRCCLPRRTAPSTARVPTSTTYQLTCRAPSYLCMTGPARPRTSKASRCDP